MKIIGREHEQRILQNCLMSGRPEFLVIYGRRRIGKTFLIREYFNHQFSFYTTGVPNTNMKGELKAFSESLKIYGDTDPAEISDWYEAFTRLRRILEKENVFRDPVSNRRVVFLDELPWMDTPKSDFRSALDFFWNSWASMQDDLLLIVCGSATSWITDHILSDTGGFYNRITRQIHLFPFTLRECKELFQNQGILMNDRQVIECYMVFGGVPYYLNCFDKRLSPDQNIDELCFRENSQLSNEYERLFHSLFKHAETYMNIISLLSGKKSGMTRSEISKSDTFASSGSLSKILNELEQCGFIRKYKPYGKGKKDCIYQIIDPFTLFCLRFMKQSSFHSWMNYINTPAYYAWRGNAFEIVCLNHISQIKQCLGISGIQTSEYSWQSSSSDPGAQIDLIIDRSDQVINICEMKYSDDEFTITKDYEKNLLHKMESFRTETGTEKSLHLTMITGNGLKHNAYAGIIQNEITAKELMRY